MNVEKLSHEDLLILYDDIRSSFTEEWYAYPVSQERRKAVEEADFDKVKEQILLRMSQND